MLGATESCVMNGTFLLALSALVESVAVTTNELHCQGFQS